MGSIGQMLDEEIERTLKEIKVCKESDTTRLLTKLDKLHQKRAKELELELEQQQHVDDEIQKRDELHLREKELEQKIAQFNADMELKTKELEQKTAQFNADVESKTKELTQRNDELKENKRARRWKTVTEILGIGLPLAASAAWIRRGLQFEEEGKIFSSRTTQWVSGITRLFRKG